VILSATEQQKAAEPLSCIRQTKLPFTSMASVSTDLLFSKHKAAWLYFLQSTALSEQQIIFFVKNVLGSVKR